MSSPAQSHPHPYPLFLKLAGRPVTIVGGGPVAERRAQLLADSGARVTIVAPQVTPLLREMSQVGTIEIRRDRFAADHLAGQVLAFAATGVPRVDREVAEAARRAGIFVNVADDAESSDFHVPAIERRGDIQVAVATGGSAPGLAARLRDRFAATIGPEWVTLAALLGEVRRLGRKRIADPALRMKALARAAKDDDLLASIARGNTPSAEEVLDGALAEHWPAVAESRQEAFVALVGAGPGSPDLVTLRGLALLETADVVLYDDLVDRRLVELAPQHAQKVYAGRRGWRDTGQRPGPDALVMYALEAGGRRVVRLKGGDPSVFGRLDEELTALREAGIQFEIVPGVTAATAAAAAAGLPLTARGRTASVTLATAVLAGETHGREQIDRLSELLRRGDTVALYMGSRSLGDIVRRFLAAGVAPSLPVTIVASASTDEQRIARMTLGQANDADTETMVAPSLAIFGAGNE